MGFVSSAFHPLPQCRHPKPRLGDHKARILLKKKKKQERLKPQNINNFLLHHSRIKSLFSPWILSVLKYLISKGGGGGGGGKTTTSEKRNPSHWQGSSAKWAKKPGFFLTVHATRCKRIYLLSKIFPYYILSNFPLKTNSACQKAPRVPWALKARMGPSRSSFLFFQEKKPDRQFIFTFVFLFWLTKCHLSIELWKK